MPTFNQIGITQIKPLHRASCHCGGVVLELALPRGVEDPRRCNCSICRRRGAICASVPLSGLRVVQGEDLLTLYQFNTHTARHYFCKICGVYTHHLRRSDPGVFAYNVGCLEGVNPFDLGEVPCSDGIHHVSDRKQGGALQ
ncbi:GFA family protein [Uliginosibacterium gangwonense]|uniref:GFA family protein n=1 Tax=Uliginosibacterium gangwonense TaxID=392736 RepID=UPI0009FF594A